MPAGTLACRGKAPYLKAVKNLLSVVLTLSLLTLAACAPSAADHVAESGPGVRYVLGIEGMTCATGCAPRVKESLETIVGVRQAEVDFESKTAIVETEPGTVLTEEACDASFNNQGYFVSSISKEAAAD